MIRKTIRIILSPLIFFVAFGAMLLFPGPIGLLMGLPILIATQLKPITVYFTEEDRKMETKDCLMVSTILFWYPFHAVYIWIKHGTIE